ncbi:hypothetical protein Sjap_015361 [Stephania japonica]|uniref:Uncharacterized protein n=1 Tax=Stephania japonica TaxID=461633 RepID=A0AAP0IIZ9_9MAGN
MNYSDIASLAPIASPSTTSAAGPARLRLWHTPLPFLFGGIAAAILLIAVSLVILLCTNYRSSSSSSSSSFTTHDIDVEKARAQPSMMPSQMQEPKFVVVMAGNDVPTYIAKPFAATNTGVHI